MGVADVDYLRPGPVNAATFSNRTPLRRIARAMGLAAGMLSVTPPSMGHTIEMSYLRVSASRDGLVVSLAFDFAAIGWIAPPDANEDGVVTPAELAAIAPAVEAFFRKTIALRVNDRPLELGSFVTAPWPRRAGAAIPESDFHRHLAVFHFRLPGPPASGELAVTIGFFGRLAREHTVLGSFANHGAEERVIFTAEEPVRRFNLGRSSTQSSSR